MIAWLHKAHLTHPLEAAVFCALGWAVGFPVEAALMCVAFFYSRECRDAEIAAGKNFARDLPGKGLVAAMRYAYGGMLPWRWSRDGVLDFLPVLPVAAASIGVAIWTR
ncbi:MAG: hypothetical protein VW338_05020 [Rhodospirillaceae bacterium]